MPAKDTYHNTVKKALEKDGWNITQDPLIIQYGSKDLFVDLGAEKVFASEKYGQKIKDIFSEHLGKLVTQKNQLRFLIFNPKTEEVVQWIV
jgi:XisH protein